MSKHALTQGQRQDVIRRIALYEPWSKLATAFGVTQETLYYHFDQNRADIAAIRARLKEQQVENGLAGVQARVSVLTDVTERLCGRLSADLMTTVEQATPSGKVVTLRQFDRETLTELRAYLGDIAKEMGDRRTRTENEHTFRVSDDLDTKLARLSARLRPDGEDGVPGEPDPERKD